MSYLTANIISSATSTVRATLYPNQNTL